jgi:hypothetical protein
MRNGLSVTLGMAMKTLAAAVLALGTVTWLSPACADELSVNEGLLALAKLSDEKCSQAQQQVAEARKGSSPQVVDAMASLSHMMCVCVPAQTKALRSSLSPQQLAAKASDSDLQARYMTEVVAKCGAEQLRANYADGCAERFAKTRPNSRKYCRCMSGVLEKIPDSEFPALALAFRNYTPRADDALQKGLPAPEPPAAIKQFLADEQACRAP